MSFYFRYSSYDSKEGKSKEVVKSANGVLIFVFCTKNEKKNVFYCVRYLSDSTDWLKPVETEFLKNIY